MKLKGTYVNSDELYFNVRKRAKREKPRKSIENCIFSICDKVTVNYKSQINLLIFFSARRNQIIVLKKRKASALIFQLQKKKKDK